MKSPLFFVLTVLAASPLLAQDAGSDSSTEMMENANMADGTNHWHGNVKPAGADGMNDFVTTTNTAVGIQIDLHSSSWTKITQDIHRVPASGMRGLILTITYQTSSDFKLSDRPLDYSNVGASLEFGGAQLPGVAGRILAFVDVPPANRSSVTNQGASNLILIYSDLVSISSFEPTADGQSHTITGKLGIPTPVQDENPTFCFAVPPGSGSITITKISLASGGSMTAGQP